MGSDTPQDPLNSAFEETLDEHRACMKIVSDVEACLDRRPDGGPWIAQLVARLEELAHSSKAHFASEAQGPLFCDVPVQHPRLAKRLERLLGEHDQIVEMLHRVVDKAKSLGDDAEIFQLREVNARAQLLIATIRRHEAEENEVMMSAMWNEVGAAD